MAKQPRLINPDCHRPVPWNEKAVQKAMAASGFLIGQVKEDGIRFHAFVDVLGQVRVVTREGIEIRSLVVHRDKLQSVLNELPYGFCLDGEVVVEGATFEEGSGLLRAYAPLEHNVKFYLFDAYPLTAMLGDEYGVAYQERIGTLCAAWCVNIHNTAVEIIEAETLHDMDDVELWFEACREHGKEGAVIKSPDLPVIHGKRTGQWKLKPSDTADGVVRGLVWGTPGLGNAGKIIGFTVELESGVLCDVTGITQAQMDLFTQQVNDSYASDDRKSPHMGRYVEIAYMEMTAAGSLRHPSFVKFRDLDYAPGLKS